MTVFTWVAVFALISGMWIACVLQSTTWSIIFSVVLFLYCIWAFVPDRQSDDQ